MSDHNGNGKNATDNALLAPPGRGGNRLRFGPGIGGKPGRSGRKPDEFKRRMAALATFAEKEGHLATVLRNPDHPHFMSAVRFVTEYGYGKVPQAVEHSGKVGGRFTFVISHPSDDGNG